MSSKKHILISTLALTANLACVQAHISVPLTHHRNTGLSRPHTHHVEAKYERPGEPLARTPEHYWLGKFSVGTSYNLSLLIDTGSYDVVINPGIYMPSMYMDSSTGGVGQLEYIGSGSDEGDKILVNVQKDVMRTQSLGTKGMESWGQVIGDVLHQHPRREGMMTQAPAGDGLVGFAGQAGSLRWLDESNQASAMAATPFFHSLCQQKQVVECRFGLALGTDGSGVHVFGGVDYDLFDGFLHSVKLFNYPSHWYNPFTWFPQSIQWYVTGGVAIDGKTMFGKETMAIDSGTVPLTGPIKKVRQIFQELGVQVNETKTPGFKKTIQGLHPCDSPPRQKVGLEFTHKDQTKIFNIEPSALRQENGDGTCQLNVEGTDLSNDLGDIWIVGQAWLEGKYVDFNDHGKSIGIAELKEKKMAKFDDPEVVVVHLPDL